MSVRGRATAQNFPDFAQNLEIFMRKPIFFVYIFYSSCFMINTNYVIFGVIFVLFLRTILKLKF